MNHELSLDLILIGLSYIFAQFLLNYKMNNIESSISELIDMLKTIKPSLKKKGKAVCLWSLLVLRRVLRIRKRRNPQSKGRCGKKRPKRQPQKGLASIVARVATGGGIARPTWSP